MRKTIAVLFAAGFFTAVASFGQTAVGDQHWAARAEGHRGGRALAAHVDAAIAAYGQATGANPNDLDARWKLLRAIRFKGAYVAATNEEKKKIFTHGKRAGDDALGVVQRLLAIKGISSLAKASEKEVAAAASSIPGAGMVFLWDAANWGEWALAYGKMAAVREGAADRIRRGATIAYLIDPRLDGGGPSRILGRLHDQTPRVPFMTGWASSKEAVRFLNESLRADPTNKITRVFLAEAMVANSSNTKPQAIQMLKDVIASPNDPQYEVEHAAAQDDARALLKKWGAR
jgi:hypothetical protein